MVHEVKEKIFLITGAAGGIGVPVVQLLLENGAQHVAMLDIAETNGTTLRDEFNSKFGSERVSFHNCDVTNEEQLYSTFDFINSKHGYIDCVINNAGICNDKISLIRKEIDINVTALIQSTLKAMNWMRKDKGGNGGTIINISSAAALDPYFNVPVYCTTKLAVLNFSRCFGGIDQYTSKGVRVLTACFGVTDTAIMASQNLHPYDDELKGELDSHVNNMRFQSAETAARGLLTTYQNGNNGSIWIIQNNDPAVDITENVNKAFNVLREPVAYIDSQGSSSFLKPMK